MAALVSLEKYAPNPLFERADNKMLLAICARRMIKRNGTGGILWGVLNLVFGAIATTQNILNLGIVFLGLAMLAIGIHALWAPSLNALLLEVVGSALLFCWNLGITILNAATGYGMHFGGLIFPFIVTFIFWNHYKKLTHLRDVISSLSAQEVATALSLCKDVMRKKVKQEPNVAEATNRARIQRLDDQIFVVHKDMLIAFMMTLDEFRGAIKDLQAKKIKMTVNHPVFIQANYSFNKKESEKIRGWIPAPAQ